MHSPEYHPIAPGWQPPAGSPPLPDAARDVVAMTEAVYAKNGFAPPWTGYMVMGGDEWIGTCAFASPPVDGRVEIAYFTFPGHEGQGIGTRMAEWLVTTARAESPGIAIVACTLPEENASTRILLKNGFTMNRDFVHPDDGLIREWEYRPS